MTEHMKTKVLDTPRVDVAVLGLNQVHPKLYGQVGMMRLGTAAVCVALTNGIKQEMRSAP